ncbi:Flp family type IVb pilin, partial [Vibrio fluvialis]|uniref:Flp family type IVb pilin n=2 Tax=Vibrio fluvialis TaxID=676 RepID=UPI001EEA0291
LEGFKMNYFNTLVTKAWFVFTSFLIDNKGASGIEYAIIATIAAIAIALFSTGDDTIADRIEAVLTSVKNALPTTAG